MEISQWYFCIVCRRGWWSWSHLKLVGFLQLVCIFILAVIHLWTDSKISFILLSTVHIYSLIAKCMPMMRTIFMLSIRTTKWTARKFMSTWLKEDALKCSVEWSFIFNYFRLAVLPLVFVSAWAFTNESSLPVQVKRTDK